MGNITLNMEFYFCSGDYCIIHLALNNSGDIIPQSKKENESNLQITLATVSGENISKTNYTVAHCSLHTGF